MLKETPVCDFDQPIIDFTLKGVDGKMHTLKSLQGDNGTLIAFICNHCPYVIAIRSRLISDAKQLLGQGVNTIAICSNNAKQYPEDSFEKMVEASAKYAYPFMYLHDESQEVARQYGAICIPDFFGYNSAGKLQYRGRLDASKKEEVSGELRRDLLIAMTEVAKTGKGPKEQIPSMGCSIKWM